MTCSTHCEGVEEVFARRTARRELKRYRRRGPRRSTLLLLEALGADTAAGGTLLDVGGGIGVIQHELLARGFSRAVHVDGSSAYLSASREEAARRGTGDRVQYHHGDVVELAPGLPAADVVTLDRVICCYPDLERLVAATAPKARRLYGLVYPRERWATRAGVALENLWLRVRGSAFRAYVHPEAAIDGAVRSHGLRRRSERSLLLWRVAIYEREPD